jgi:hypothetical protein
MFLYGADKHIKVYSRADQHLNNQGIALRRGAATPKLCELWQAQRRHSLSESVIVLHNPFYRSANQSLIRTKHILSLLSDELSQRNISSHYQPWASQISTPPPRSAHAPHSLIVEAASASTATPMSNCSRQARRATTRPTTRIVCAMASNPSTSWARSAPTLLANAAPASVSLTPSTRTPKIAS